MAPSADGTSKKNAGARPPLNPNPPSVASPLQNETHRQSDSSAETDLKGAGYEESRRDICRFMLDPAGDRTHDETTVDVVTVPCPGADALRSWNRDGLLSRYFGALSMRDPEVDRPDSAPSWVRQGIRREVDIARILLYEHPLPEEGVTLDGLADEFLDQLGALREREGAGGRDATKRRPLVFVAHSIGGIVVKMALVKASRQARFESIVSDCYGVVFFGTPHQGSSYFAMPSLVSSVQNILQLSVPLPQSISSNLDVGDARLLLLDGEFKSIAHEMRVWTFYETIDSRLSASASGAPSNSKRRGDGVYFTAPMTSVKSAILGMRQERVFPLQSDHANVASFGHQNTHTLRLFLRQLALLIDRADSTLHSDEEGDGPARWSLDLEQRISVEVRGFFEDSSTGELVSPVVRAWSTKVPLAEFLRKGPEECLEERLKEVVEQVPIGADDNDELLGRSPPAMPLTDAQTEMIKRQVSDKEGLGIANQLIRRADTPPTPLSPILRPVDSPSLRSAPDVITTPPQNARVRRLSSPPIPTMARATTATTRYSATMRRPSPLIRPEFDQDLAIDRLSPPTRTRSFLSAGRSSSDLSIPYVYRDFPPFSQQRSHSTAGDHGSTGRRLSRDERAIADDEAEIAALPQLPASITAPADAEGQASSTVPANAPVSFAPTARSRKFVWVHLPYNNPTWVNKIIQTLEKTHQEDYSALYGHDFWASKHTRGRHSQHYAYFAKPGCYFTAPRALSPLNNTLSPPISPIYRQPTVVPLCLFLPYLHFDSYKRLIRRRDLIFERLANGRAHPVPAEVAKTDSMELQVLWEYLGHDPPVNCRRTLDQFGYPALRDTRGRDDDQMLYKLTKERDCRYGQYHGDVYTYSLNSRAGSHGSYGSVGDGLVELERIQEQNSEEEKDGIRNGNVLMVDQLWLWVVHYDTLVSFFPKRESDPIEGPLYQQADLRDSIVNEVNVDLARQCENSFDLAALAALHSVSVLLDRTSHPDLEVFRIFGEAISVLTEKLTHSLKTFRVEGFKDKAAADEPVENRESSIRRRHREEGRRAEKENRDNTSALLELRDLEDELQVLLELFERQQVVLSSMLTAYSTPPLRDRTAHGRAFIAEAISRVAEYRRRADDMTQRVRLTRDEYDKLLQMVQRQAQVDEVRLSRLHADLATSQGRSIMIFTVFTIIFLPLSFFTSLFGMNTREWEDNGPLPLPTIGLVSLPSSFALITLSLIAAFSDSARRLIFSCRDTIYDWSRWLYDLLLDPVVDAIMSRYRQRQKRKQRERQRALSRNRGRGDGGSGGTGAAGSGGAGRNGRGDDWRDVRRGMRKETSDFWERNRPERERGYQIPDVNRKKVGGKKKAGAKGKKEGR